MDNLELRTTTERWPIAGEFRIARGSKSEAVVVVAELGDGTHRGRGECTPYARYGESPESVVAALEQIAGSLRPDADHALLARLLPAGAARNAIDCALWDLMAKRSGRSVAALAGTPPAPGQVVTAYTLSLDSPEAMAARARAVPNYPLLKLKLGGAGDEARMAAVRAARPDARLVADANESWPPESLAELLAAAAASNFELIEQPLPAAADGALGALARPVPVCADESIHTSADLERLAGRYDAVNIKLDKAGGLTEALALAAAARARGLRIMLGCMVATSLSMAPAMLLAGLADWVDLDGPLLLARDREHGLAYDGARISPAKPELWG